VEFNDLIFIDHPIWKGKQSFAASDLTPD